jgi:hypothetical protein
MAGQPRRRLAHRLAVRMANELRREGPLHVDVLLDRLGYGPLNHEQMSRIERAAERMAVRDVQQSTAPGWSPTAGCRCRPGEEAS